MTCTQETAGALDPRGNGEVAMLGELQNVLPLHRLPELSSLQKLMT